MRSESEFLYSHGKLRPVVDSDLEDLRRWRNHPKVRKAMITQHEISPEEHSAWWEKVRRDDTKRWYIYTEKDMSSAVIYFFRLSRTDKTGWWGFYLCDYSEEASAGRGALAQRIVKTMIDHAFHGMDLRLLLCEVWGSNAAAVRLYQKCGFAESRVASSKAGASLIVMELKNPGRLE